MTLQEFERQLGAIGEQLEETPAALVQLGEQIVSRMKLAVPVDTGALRSSIRYAVTGTELQFSMLEYGAFQNFGVKGTGGPFVRPVPLGVEPQPANPPFYAFRTREFGLRPQPFYDVDQITDELMEALVNNIPG